MRILIEALCDTFSLLFLFVAPLVLAVIVAIVNAVIETIKEKIEERRKRDVQG